MPESAVSVTRPISTAGYRVARRILRTGRVPVTFDLLPEDERPAVVQHLLAHYETDLAAIEHKIARLQSQGRPAHVDRLRQLQQDRANHLAAIGGVRELLAEKGG